MAIYEHIPEADTYLEAATIVIGADNQDQKLALIARTPKASVVVIGISGAQLLALLAQARDAREARPNILDWQPYRPV